MKCIHTGQVHKWGLSLGLASMALAMCDLARAEEHAKKDIVESAIEAEEFSTLVTAVKAAELVDALRGEGPFTVFAPTNDAFAKISKEKLAALLKDKDALTAVLTYHVLPGKLMAADVVKLTSADTLQGDSLRVAVKDGKVTVNGVNVIATDIECKNGVIHVIDGVLTPSH